MPQAPIALNDDPVDGGLTTNEDTPFSTIDLRLNDYDPDGDAITVINVEGALIGEDYILSGSGAIIRLNANGTVSYNTNNQFDGLSAGDIYYDSFNYTISDGTLTSTATVTIAVEGLEEDGGGGGGNDAPTAFDDEPSMGGLTTNEDTPFTTVSLQLNDTDPEDDWLTVVSINGAAVGEMVTLASGAQITLNADGTVNYNTNGVFGFLNGGDIFYDDFTYLVSDGVNTSGATVTVAVEGVTNGPPGATEGDDTLSGGINGDNLSGLGGNDKLYGNDGNDTLSGGNGVDYLVGGNGDDKADGGAGKDHLVGGEGNDALLGGLDSDKLYGSAGQDSLHGGDGADRLFGEAGNDKLYGDAGKDNLSGGDGADYLRGGADHDTISGDAGNDHLIGDDGHDTLSGGDNTDKLYGGSGNDTLNGGFGVDRLWGEAGADEFVFHAGDSTASSRDTIEDFEVGVDVINLSSMGFAGLVLGAASGNILGYDIVGNDAVIYSETGTVALRIAGATDFDVVDVIV